MRICRAVAAWGLSVAACLSLAGLPSGPAVAAEAGAAIAVVVPLPITGTRDKQVEAAILRRLDTLKRGP